MKKFGVLGFPLKHSLSPLMHTAALQELRIEAVYDKYEIAAKDLNCFMKRVKTGEFAGLSVTVPYKEEVLPYCDELSEQAEAIGAVNTLYVKEGKVIGENTDWYGFIEALKEVEPDLNGLKFLILGAGGVARACVYALNKEGIVPVVYNRTKEKAIELSNKFNCIVVESLKDKFDVIVNCTSVGLHAEDPLLVSEDIIKAAKIVYDLVYLETPLVREARACGVKIVDSKRMLLLQGVKQFELFTGENPNFEVMWESIKN